MQQAPDKAAMPENQVSVRIVVRLGNHLLLHPRSTVNITFHLVPESLLYGNINTKNNLPDLRQVIFLKTGTYYFLYQFLFSWPFEAAHPA